MTELKYKYTLIVSQYYYSRHMFIVEHTEDFLEKARAMARELMKHKRGDDHKEYYESRSIENELGDLSTSRKHDEINLQYNINDAGDIYFIQANYANRLAYEWQNYAEDSRRGRRGYQKNAIVQKISKRHSYDEVAEIVKKHFTIV